ncbi:hypothetical protein SBF1_8260002 [Candidatus Desulfosporosinus infrequens]|uniref:LysM domain-containing protein n=1 Tax=Candidatus Desulfosporosinus infrequens TaxID=2043169 RepID=A0A2U3LU30_9FIRM|nr:hypothetical protein SBF1_8260002 [Candidatus Desulfosporosinus infrequens]
MQYTIQPGDSLYSIAMQYGTTVSNLMSLNPQIPNPHEIYTGETITVPSGNQWGGNNWGIIDGAVINDMVEEKDK